MKNVNKVSSELGANYATFEVELRVDSEFSANVNRIIDALHATLEDACEANNVRLVEVYRMVLPMAALGITVVAGPSELGARVSVLYQYDDIELQGTFVWPDFVELPPK